MVKSKTFVKRVNTWYDGECKKLKRESNIALRNYRTNKTNVNFDIYWSFKSKYKNTCRTKRWNYEKSKTTSLENSLKNPRLFWEKVRELTGHTVRTPDISDEAWLVHFKTLFGDAETVTENIFDVPNSSADEDFSEIENDILNTEITSYEISAAIKGLKLNKSSTGQLVPAHFIYGLHFLLPYIVKIFNKIYMSGIFPEAWSHSVLVPIHKKGEINNPDNYRGIALLDVFSKIYISILNKRVTTFTEIFDKITESQSGFREGYSTIDNAFILQSLASKILSMKKRKLFVAFVDFHKAFDSVNRSKLYSKLRTYKIGGKLLQAIKAIYESVKLSVKCNSKITESFSSSVGLRQGCNLSPILFSLYINDLQNVISRADTHGIQLCPSLVEILLLMFADDVALLSDTVLGLQKQLNALHQFCIESELKVNINKTKVLVFRKGGVLSHREKWFYNGSQLDCVSGFSYVGVYFTQTLSMYKMAEQNALKGRKVLNILLKNLLTLPNLSSKTFFKIFDTKVSPILFYGCELWGLNSITAVENVHIYACKRFLNASPNACNAAVMGDLGRYPLLIEASKRCIKYWLKLLECKDDRFIKLSYDMLKMYDDLGYVNWVTEIRLNLYKNGFGYIWEAQSVTDKKSFLSKYTQRLRDQYIQNWKQDCVNNTKLSLSYIHYKTIFGLETYVNCVDLRKYKRYFINFRASSHTLNIEVGRHQGVPREQRLCNNCQSLIEDEYHFVLICPLYSEIRQRFIPEKFTRYPTRLKFNILLASKSETLVRNISLYLYHAFRHRSTIYADSSDG